MIIVKIILGKRDLNKLHRDLSFSSSTSSFVPSSSHLVLLKSLILARWRYYFVESIFSQVMEPECSFRTGAQKHQVRWSSSRVWHKRTDMEVYFHLFLTSVPD